MNKCLISIIMPTYNRGYIIKDAIQSVLEQTISNWELIIIDDASTDNTECIIREIVDSRITYKKNGENRGANYSRNRGCSIAKGEFLAFLDSDNIWMKNKLERQLALLKDSADNIAFSFCKMELVDGKKRIVPDKDFKIGDLESILRIRNVVDTNTVLLKKEVYETVGGFDDDMPRMQDWDMFFRIVVEHHYEAVYTPEILDYNVIQRDSISRCDYKFLSARRIFLEKHWEVLTPEEIVRHFIGILQTTKNEKEALALINGFMDNEAVQKKNLYGLLFNQLFRYIKYYNMLLLWKKNMEKSTERTIFHSDYQWDNFVIALYGLGIWGDLIYHEAKNCGVKIKYGIDKKVKQFHDVKIVKMSDIPKDVNLILVSVFQEYDKICEQLEQYYKGEILSIERLLKRNLE